MAKKKKTEPAKSGMAESETYQRWRRGYKQWLKSENSQHQ
jgi:hypothetical protein